MIDREKVIGLLNEMIDYFAICRHNASLRIKAAEHFYELQSAAKDALELLKEQEPKRGRWERLTGMAPPEYHGHKICSVCECFAPYDPIHMGREMLTPYCPGCGAKMDGEAEDE